MSRLVKPLSGSQNARVRRPRFDLDSDRVRFSAEDCLESGANGRRRFSVNSA
jgi:hypothetical protein